MLNRLSREGIYGSRQTFVNHYFQYVTKDISIDFLKKPVYLFRRTFPVYREMAYRYPSLHKKPWMLPVYWIRRFKTKKERISGIFQAVQNIRKDRE